MTTISVLVISDTICPWCYIGYKELKIAMERTREEHPDAKFELEYRPFLLDPSLSCRQSVDKNEHLTKKFGETRYKTACQFLVQRGSELGITFRFSGNLRQTVSSHRLLVYAYQKEPKLQEALLIKLFAAFFEEAKDIGDFETLAALAEEAGVMSKEDTITFLKSDSCLKEVQVLMMDAQHKGITGVPFTVINQKYAITGAQKAEAYVEVFNRLIAMENLSETDSSPAETCQITPPSREICT
ncbi:hypothetical protein FRB94_009029 [Tulasnella sp. JGI-2019a]|nr:hypothetical protein FRB93_003443 [Tulasnella sp. JGI-2019a]KAG9014871.1 hypothetical protein FRB94_009029 [Tulasnella sp. JGI-2019a]KAG9039967.1 hypothetical protein FRB95_004439 [Tulasnella sp. JGI-2019a]